MRLRILVAALLAVTIQSPADASTVAACVTTGTMTFSPRLTTQFTSGQVTLTYTNTCAAVDSAGGSGLTGRGGVLTYSYAGSCLTATFVEDSSAGVSGLMAGGLLALTTQTGDRIGVRIFVIVPTSSLGNPCDMATATFVNAGPDVRL